MSICHGCKKIVKNSEKICCSQESCEKQFHFLCVNLNTDNFKKQKNWKCPDCSIYLLSALRKEGNFDSTPVKIVSYTEEITKSDAQNVTTRRPPSAKSNTNWEISNMHEDFVLRSEITSIMRNELRAVIRNILDEEFTRIKSQLQEFQKSLSHINLQFDKAISDVKLCMENTQQLQSENILLKKKVNDMELRLSQVEQDARQNNIEIHCLPEHKQENLLKTVTQLSSVVSYPITENDILSCNRVQKLNSTSKMPRTVICKLSNKLKRDNLLAAVLTYNKANPKQKLNTKLLGYGNIESPVYVSEHLTPSNKALHAQTRIKAKEKQYKYVWVRNGKIFVRKDETSPALVITHQDFL